MLLKFLNKLYKKEFPNLKIFSFFQTSEQIIKETVSQFSFWIFHSDSHKDDTFKRGKNKVVVTSTKPVQKKF